MGWDEKYPRKEVSPNKVRGIGMATAIHSSGISGNRCCFCIDEIRRRWNI